MKLINHDWGFHLRLLRQHKGKTQEDIEHSSEISQTCITKLENGKTRFQDYHLLKIAIGFDIPVSHLVYYLENGKFDTSAAEIEAKQAANLIELKNVLSHSQGLIAQLEENYERLIKAGEKDKLSEFNDLLKHLP